MGTPTLAVALAAVLFATTGTAAALGPDTLSPQTAGAWRSIIGGVVMIVWVATRHRGNWRRGLRLRWLLAGGIGVAVYQLAFFDAVSRTGVAVGTLVTIGTGPVVAGLLDLAVYRRRSGRRWLIGALIALIGVALLTVDNADIDWAGIGLAVLAGTSFPVYGLAAQRLMSDTTPEHAITGVFVVGMTLLLPFGLSRIDEAFATGASTLTVVYLGVVTLAVAYLLWGFGLSRLTLPVVVLVTLLEPAVAALLGVGLLDEAFTPAIAAGVVLVSIGVALASIRTSAAVVAG